MRKVEELLAAISPKLALDHYWNVLDLIDWRLFIDLDLLLEGKKPQKKEEFTLSDITIFLSNEIRKTGASPFYRRRCLRSIEMVKDAVGELINFGLIIKKNDIFRKSEEYPRFFQILKRKIRTGAKRRVAWAVWYLYHKGLSFSTSQLLTELSYRDEEYADEIPHLLIPKENRWSKLVEKRGDMWRLLEEPYLPTRPLLLLDVQRRLYATISKLSKSEDEFRTEEIIVKLRQLEKANIERFLRSMGLKPRDGIWEMNDIALRNVKRILMEIGAGEWPFFGVLIARNPYFKLLGSQSRTLYVDIPNSSIFYFVNELQRISYEHSGNQEEMHRRAVELANASNRRFKRTWKWLSFKIRKAPFIRKPFGLQIRIDWKEFIPFLEDFSQKDISLKDKYEYILDCRAPSLTLIMRGDLERTQHDVEEICGEETKQIKNDVDDLVNSLRSNKNRLYKISKRKTIPKEYPPSTLQYLPEIISTLNALTFLIENGTIPACYREMRKVIENLSWMMFDDLLLFKSPLLKSRKRIEVALPNPYGFISREWYNWAKQSKSVIRDLSEIKSDMDCLVKQIHSYGEEKGYSWGEKHIEEVFFKRLSASLFLLLVGKKAQVPRRQTRFVPQYKAKSLLSLAAEDLKKIIEELRQTRSKASDNRLIEELVKVLEQKTPSEMIVPPYPSNEFVLGFVDKTLSIKFLKQKYDEYSHFVHSYFTSWHIFPFSSVLEFKIFRHEFSIFAQGLQQVMDTYFKELFP